MASKRTSLYSHAHNGLCAFLRKEGVVGGKLMAQRDLAAKCGASRTTLNKVLRSLKQHGILAEADGTFVLKRLPEKQDLLPEPATLSRREAVEQSLINMLVEGKFVPGQKFSELSLAKEHSVTTGTMREALLRLAPLKIFTKQERKQWQVVHFGADIVNEMMDLRILMESFGLERYFLGGQSPPLKKAFNRIFEDTVRLKGSPKPDRKQFFKLDRELHETILAGAENRYLMEYSQYVAFPIQLQFVHRAFDQSLVKFGLNQHIDLLRAIRAGDCDRATRLLKDHLEYARATLLRLSPEA